MLPERITGKLSQYELNGTVFSTSYTISFSAGKDGTQKKA